MQCAMQRTLHVTCMHHMTGDRCFVHEQEGVEGVSRGANERRVGEGHPPLTPPQGHHDEGMWVDMLL